MPCEGRSEPLSESDENMYLEAVKDWELDRSGVHQLSRELVLGNFGKVLGVVNKVGQLAESEGHHPNLYMYEYKKLRIELYTHAIGGLSMNDFIMAAKIDELLGQDG